MKLWLISQNVNNGYGTYDSAVVAAETAEEARRIHPDGDPAELKRHINYDTWATFEHIEAKLIGEACPGTQSGVILASFIAG